MTNSSAQIKTILIDSIFILLIANMFLVIAGYGVISILGSGFFAAVKGLRIVTLIAGFFWVLHKNGLKFNRLRRSGKFTFFMIVLVVSSAFYFGTDGVLYNLLNLLLGFLYILLSVNYLLRYGLEDLLSSFSIGVFFCFSFVVLAYFAFGGSLTNTNIYGETEDGAFVSNHYGWSASLVALAAVDIIKNFKLNLFTKFLLSSYLIILFFLLIISASRSGLLAVGMTTIFLLFKSNQVKPIVKFLIVGIPLVIFFNLKDVEDSAINFVIEKSQSQLGGKDDGRLESGEIMFEVFNNNPGYYLTGIGMFNTEYLERGNSILGKYHNSYLEILFGAGIIVFGVFLSFMVLRPFRVFWKVAHSSSLLFFPLLIIPFFESDLTPGQFLFFPWFGYMLILNAKDVKLKNRKQLT
ncbi:O-antigen ligase family protein [Nonlabens ponticola]|uniref:O-antigen ligase domain-containing protein n=1 Tax=Nonlabens ponticola TaxID=2496866 RepID=A0A3S9MZZ0_9FLAO|nr:O-antigen ligase family protein [Nonlabens ponticola]AZQ44694.1 O-antigen ligase domain-containing protein [Nonlabens ponticola]